MCPLLQAQLHSPDLPSLSVSGHHRDSYVDWEGREVAACLICRLTLMGGGQHQVSWGVICHLALTHRSQLNNSQDMETI